jgi:hypothetical protein
MALRVVAFDLDQGRQKIGPARGRPALPRLICSGNPGRRAHSDQVGSQTVSSLVGEPITLSLVGGLVAVFIGIWISTTETHLLRVPRSKPSLRA